MHGKPSDQSSVQPYAWYMLAVLCLVYVLNFVDRQMLTILAPDLKRDLGISDSEFGFLYGTAFGVFYALFGIPLGKLADRWSRVGLLAIGLTLWSTMTALSGLSRNFGQIAATRVGVGVGEATAAPCAYSLISDYFPPRLRATALGVYSAGLYLGSGFSLFVGSRISSTWNETYAGGTAPLGLAGWQAAFLLVGVPGLLLALVVAFLREPLRGRFDVSEKAAAPAPETVRPWRGFLDDLSEVVPPFTVVGAWRRGAGALTANLVAAAVACAIAFALIKLTGDTAQWSALALGGYAIFSWATALRARDRATFAILLGSRAFLCLTLGYAFVAFIGYATTAFSPLYAISSLGAVPEAAGMMLGGLGALGGALGVIAGGIVADRAARNGDHARRVAVILLSAAAAVIAHAVMFSTGSLNVFYVGIFFNSAFLAATLGASSGTIVNIVPSNVRGVATATFLLGTNMVGLGLGPYTAGKVSELVGDLGTAMLAMLGAVPVMLTLIAVSWVSLRRTAAAA